MSLNALNTSTAGLQVTQAAIGLVSQNVANAGTAGYVKRTLTSSRHSAIPASPRGRSAGPSTRCR